MFLAVFVTMYSIGSTTGGFCKRHPKAEIRTLVTPPEHVQVYLGETVSIECVAKMSSLASADPLVYWTTGPRGKRKGQVARAANTLYFERITAKDIGEYECVIEDCGSFQTLSHFVNITQRNVPPCHDVYGVGLHLYAAQLEFATWGEAKLNCLKLGMHLAFPMTPKENEDMLLDVGMTFDKDPNATKFDSENYLWIGGCDEEERPKHFRPRDRVWLSEPHGARIRWKNFDKGQPDNKYGGQDCISLNRATGKWDDSFSHKRKPYVCKCDVVSPYA